MNYTKNTAKRSQFNYGDNPNIIHADITIESKFVLDFLSSYGSYTLNN